MKNPDKEILINHTQYETRVVLLVGDRLTEFYCEREKNQGLSGNIYKGRVVRVLPGMQAAFVDIGLERTAFIHVSDLCSNTDEAMEGEKQRRENRRVRRRIEKLIKAGQDIMVQVQKEPMGSKGARITSRISIPGRDVVLMPTVDHIGISRRIDNDRERKRLRDIIEDIKPDGYGVIVRTACEDVNEADIDTDMNFILRLWKDVLDKYNDAASPSLLYGEPDLSLRSVRDIFTQDVGKVLIDSETEHERVLEFTDKFLPSLSERVELYKGREPLFDFFGVELEITNALERKVWLKSGGFIVIDQMEALTAIDVNTGKYVGKKSSEETILKTNLEAVKEIAYQLRLRNIGGIIVIDFIDMQEIANCEKVYRTLKESVKVDRARTNILTISELGIVEMTRARVRGSISAQLCEPCPYCEGNAVIKGRDTIVMEIYRSLMKELPKKRKKKIFICVNPAIADTLCSSSNILETIEEQFRKKIIVKTVDLFHQEQFEIG